MNSTKSQPTGRLSGAWRKALTLGASLAATLLLAPAVFANGSMLDYTALPPLISPSSLSDMPNVLVVLDNSNSMDETPSGVAVGSADPSSKSEIARNTIKGLIGSLKGRIRMGLMAYQQSGVGLYYIHNSFYYSNYDPTTYDPSYVPSGAPSSWTKNNQRIPNATDPGNYLYYNRALPFYASSDQGNAFCYSPTYNETVDPFTGNSYYCYRDKTGQSNDTSSAAAGGYSGTLVYHGRFIPTDSDIAEGFYYFGARMAWQKVQEPDPDHPGLFTNKTYFSSSHPGRGYLYVPINTLDSTQASTLDSWLATESFANPSSNKPLRNAGFTPIQGTLLTAKDYFEGNLTDTAQGGPASAPPANACGVKNYVILVTDGLPSVDKDGNLVTDPTTAISEAADSASQLLADGVKTYVVGFGLPQGQDPTTLDQIASAGGTTSAYLASNSASLLNALNSIFLDIAKRTSSGTAATVVSNSSNGTGAVYQAYYTPSMTLAQNVSGGALSTVTWVGGVHALFIDKYSYLREDSNQNGKLDDYDTDKIVELRYDPTSGKTVVARATSTDPNVPQGLTWTTSALGTLKPIWNAQDRLSDLTDVTTQRTYSDNANTGRYVFTLIDGTVEPFDDATFGSGGGNNFRYLDASNTTEAQKIVDYIRGEEIPGFRNRTIDYKQDGTLRVWRLGDIIHSTPAAVGAPDSGYDVAYGDTTYAAFQQQYANRRQVVYVGANDGMLHAFNGGFWDATQQSFDTVDPTGSGATPDPLGSELWAYVPENLLPHLQWLTDPNYNHVYYMDGAIKTFDARIFTPDADHPYGWGTILVAGMRLGGGPFSIDTTGDGTQGSHAQHQRRLDQAAGQQVVPGVRFRAHRPDVRHQQPGRTVVRVRTGRRASGPGQQPGQLRAHGPGLCEQLRGGRIRRGLEP
ncbi:MAG: PilC/PilY family type IV pilus protein [Gammaproteobacteria bacterium]